jgi:plasmid stabilization system protein ParE
VKREDESAVLPLVWTERAANDLDAIADFIATDNAVAAVAWVEALVAAVQPVAQAPRMGRQVPEFAREDLREVIHRTYRIVYRVAPDRIEVLTVFEGHRLLRL